LRVTQAAALAARLEAALRDANLIGDANTGDDDDDDDDNTNDPTDRSMSASGGACTCGMT
jgi:hypothetical protein